LIQAGFGRSPADIARTLTWRQFVIFNRALERQRRTRLADHIEGTALAFGAKNIKKVIEDLRRE
jgi:hypothetical protein